MVAFPSRLREMGGQQELGSCLRQRVELSSERGDPAEEGWGGRVGWSVG